jgi:hypothetical protein
MKNSIIVTLQFSQRSFEGVFSKESASVSVPEARFFLLSLVLFLFGHEPLYPHCVRSIRQ